MRRNFKRPAALLLILCFAVSSVACERKCPRRYLIPKGYVGWVRVFFNVKGASMPPNEDGVPVLKFRPARVLRLDVPMYDFTECKPVVMDFYYYDEKGETQIIPLDYELGLGRGTTMIQNLASGKYQREVDAEEQYFEEFFVGTMEQFEKRDQSKDSLGQYRGG